MLMQMNAMLVQLERTAWQMRAVSDELVRLGGEARVWKARTARLSATSWMLTRVVADYRLYAIYSAFLSRKQGAARLARIHRRAASRFYLASVEQQANDIDVPMLRRQRQCAMAIDRARTRQ